MSEELQFEDITKELQTENRYKFLTAQEISKLFIFHNSIVGGSGSGKTVLTNKIFSVMPSTSIYFNVMGIHGIQGIEARTVKEFDLLLYQDTFKNQTHKIVISPKTSEDIKSYIARVIFLVKRIRRLQDIKYERRIKRRVNLFFDEVQYLCENSEFLEQARNISLMGRNKELFANWISQRPQNVNKNLFTQSNMFFGLLKEFDHNYLKSIRMSVPDCKRHEFYFMEQMTDSLEEFDRQFIKLNLNGAF